MKAGKTKVIAALLIAVLFAVGCSGNNAPETNNAPAANTETQGKTNDAGENKAAEGEAAADKSGVNPEGFPIVNEKITLKLLGPKEPIHGPWDQMDFFKKMEEMTNVHFEFDTPPKDNFAEKKNLIFASGELPDVLFGARLTPNDEVNYGGQGMLIPLEDLIDKYAPNIKKMLDEHPDVRSSITAGDGHIYALPQVTELAHNLITKTWVNGDWLAKTGMTAPPKTLDEYYDMLKKFRDGDPNGNGQKDEIPLSGIDINNVRTYMLTAFGILGNGAEAKADKDKSWIQVKNDKVEFIPTTEGFKEYLTFMNKLYAEKLLDNEIFSHTNDEFTAKGKSGRIGVFTHAAPFLVLDIKTDEENFKHPTMMPLTSAVNPEPVFPLNNAIQRGTFAITSGNKHPEATMRWVDYLYTEEGGALLNSGIEGKGWKWLDAEKKTWDRIAAEGKNVEETRGQNTPDPGSALPTYKGKNFHYKINNPVTQWLHKVSEDYLRFAKTSFPLVYFTDEEQQRLNIITTDLNTYVGQMEAKFILSKDPASLWDEYVGTIRKMNVDELVSIYQAAYDRWKQAN